MEEEQPELQVNKELQLLYEFIQWIKNTSGGIYRISRNMRLDKAYLFGTIELNESSQIAELGDLQYIELFRELPYSKVNEKENVSVKKIEIYLILTSQKELFMTFLFRNAEEKITKEMKYLLTHILIRNDFIRAGVLQLVGKDEEIKIHVDGDITVRIYERTTHHKASAVRIETDLIKYLNLYVYKKLVIEPRRRIDFIFDEMITVSERLKTLDRAIVEQLLKNKGLTKEGKGSEIRPRAFRFTLFSVKTNETKSISLRLLKNTVLMLLEENTEGEKVEKKETEESRKRDMDTSCFIKYKDIFICESGWSWLNSSNSFMFYRDIVKSTDDEIKEQLKIIMRNKRYIIVDGFEVLKKDNKTEINMK